LRRVGDFAVRAERADALAESAEAARGPLLFAAGLYRAQAVVVERVARMSGLIEQDADALLGASAELIAFMRANAPGLTDLVLAAEHLVAHVRERRSAVDAVGFAARSVLRPYFEALTTHDGSCGPPWIAARRENGERVLHCAWCAAEEVVNRILCPACGEGDPKKLPTFSSDSYSNVRIEACESCRRYLKSIDLTLDARPIPEVDDLLSLSLDLWAVDQGFVRIEPGLAGI
jgi:formate dehydrogenase maturation protein FdhE